MEILELKKDLHWCGVQDPELKVFDVIMETKYGTSYNSYFLKGSEKSVLFETVKEPFFDEYIEALSKLTDISKIDYLIVSHTELDHAGSIEKLLDINPNIVIVASNIAINFLKNIVERDFKSQAVKDNDELSLGDKTLKFIVAPNLHWPDTIFTYWVEEKTLFSCDAFGEHYSFDGVLKSKLTDQEGYEDSFKYYYDMIMGPFTFPHVTNAMKKIEGLEIDYICPGHGPVLDVDVDYALDKYKKWSTPVVKDKKKVVIAYVSAYGYTKTLAEEIYKGINSLDELDVVMYDVEKTDTALLDSELASSDGFLLGTPTIVGQPLKPVYELTLNMFAPIYRGKHASAFGSYGWSGEAVPYLLERFKQLQLKTVDGLRVKFKPFKEDLENAYEFGIEFGKTVLNK